MRAFIKYIITYLTNVIKKLWYDYQRKLADDHLNQQKKESKNAIKESNEAVDDFESYYKLYEQEQSGNQEAGDIEDSVDKTTKDSESKDS